MDFSAGIPAAGAAREKARPHCQYLGASHAAIRLRINPAGRGWCSSSPFHAKLLHRRQSAAVAACHSAAPAPTCTLPRLSATRLNGWCGLPGARLQHRRTAVATSFESPLRVARHRLQHPGPAVPLGDSVRQRTSSRNGGVALALGALGVLRSKGGCPKTGGKGGGGLWRETLVLRIHTKPFAKRSNIRLPL